MLGKNKTVLFLFISVAAVFIIHALYLSTIAEDAFISFRYAKNLAAGNGLVWNAGETPVEGYTNFLWILISSIILSAGLNLLIFSQVIGLFASTILLIYVYLFCKRILGFNKYTSILPSLFLAFSGPFATWATSGMETNFFTLFVFASFYHLIFYWQYQKTGSIIFSLFLIMIATLTRPEGFGIFLILVSFHLYHQFKETKSKGIHSSIIFILIFYIFPILIYFFWRYSYFGYILPLTFYAKTGGTVYQWLRGLKYLFFFSFHFLVPLIPIVLVYLFIKIDHIKLSGIFKTKKSNTEINIFSFKLYTILCLLYTFYIVLVGGDYMAMYRFFVPVLPLIYILLAAGFNLMKNSGQILGKNSLAVIFILIALTGTILQSTPLEKVLFHKPGITHGQYQGVCTERWHTNRLTLIGKFFNEYKKSDDESIATDAIGAISFYSNLKVYDFHGLVDPVIARMQIENLGKGFPGHEKINLLYTLSKQPTYFINNRKFTNEPADYPSYSPEVNKVLQSEYRVVSKWLVDEKNNEEGYFTFLERIDQ